MRILCVDAGSSTLKLALYEMPSETCLESVSAPLGDDGTLSQFLLRAQPGTIAAASHRIVFGGAEHVEPEILNDTVVSELEQLGEYDPLHLRSELAAVRAIASALPVPQIACFDTAFHHAMPEVAKRYALPSEFRDIRRYGYHGLSYEYITSVLEPADSRIIAHLGSGASLAAIKGGKPVDTTMGFTPLGGLIMATRPGDLDPGVLLYALKGLGLTVEQLDHLLNGRSGLLAISEMTGDMQTLLQHADSNDKARLAIDMFVYSICKQIGAMTAAMNGLNELVFTGGIGENSAAVRRRIALGLTFLGISLDDRENEQHHDIISTNDSAVVLRVVKTNEALVLARHAAALLATLKT